MSYLIVEYANRTTPEGIVISQTPSAGAKADADADAQITLYVSLGHPIQHSGL